MKYKILAISSNLDEYPDAVKDTDQYPHLVKWLDDEFGLFVYCEDNDLFYPATEFFLMEDIATFETDTQELRDKLDIATRFIEFVADQHKDIAPNIVNGEIELTMADRTWLKLRRNT